MVLPQAVLFPHSLLPLYIFEPKYREMLAFALENERVFCIASSLPDGGFSPIAGAGVIRACVTNPDGTSHLVLQGVCRVRLGANSEEQDFVFAPAEPILSVCHNPALATDLAARLIAIITSPVACELGFAPQLVECLRGLSDQGAFADILAASVIADPEERSLLLAEPSADVRLERLVIYLSGLFDSEVPEV